MVGTTMVQVAAKTGICYQMVIDRVNPAGALLHHVNEFSNHRSGMGIPRYTICN